MRKNFSKSAILILMLFMLLGTQSFTSHTSKITSVNHHKHNAKISWAYVGHYTCQCTPFRTIYVWVWENTTTVAYVSLGRQPTTFYSATGTYTNLPLSVSNCVSSAPALTCNCSYTGSLTF